MTTRSSPRSDTADLTKEQAAILIGQWWHPLHYFPTFLAKCVAALPDIAAKSAIARILNQEAGDGVVSRAHEVIYVDSMEKCGFDRDRVTGAAPYPETAALVEGYRTASEGREIALGFIFATETTDLLMVSSIGKAIERTTGVTDNEWVSIHVEQEPDHVEEANHALLADFSAGAGGCGHRGGRRDVAAVDGVLRPARRGDRRRVERIRRGESRGRRAGDLPAFPRWTQHFWTWQTGKALPGQKPMLRHTWATYLAVTLTVFFAGLAVSTRGGGGDVPVLVPRAGRGLAAHGLRGTHDGPRHRPPGAAPAVLRQIAAWTGSGARW